MTIEIAIVAATALLSVSLMVSAVLVRRARNGRGQPELTERLAQMESTFLLRDESLRESVGAVESRLTEMKANLASREAVLNEQVGGLGSRMSEISALFGNDRARGGWGEVSLRRILELGQLVEGRDFTQQARDGDLKPDVIIHLPGGADIVVDSKFPVARYLEAVQTDDPTQKGVLLESQGQEILRVGSDLAKRRYSDIAHGGYVIMYLPSQSVFEAVCEANQAVLESLLEKRVVVAGPTSLFAVVSSVGAVLAEHRAHLDAKRIVDDVRELHRRLSTWIGHLGKIGAGLESTIRAFNGAVGSWSSRVGPLLGRISDSAGEAVPGDLEQIDEAIRSAPQEESLRAAS